MAGKPVSVRGSSAHCRRSPTSSGHSPLPPAHETEAFDKRIWLSSMGGEKQSVGTELRFRFDTGRRTMCEPAFTFVAVSAYQARPGSTLQPGARGFRSRRLDVDIQTFHHRAHQMSLAIHSFGNFGEDTHYALLRVHRFERVASAEISSLFQNKENATMFVTVDRTLYSLIALLARSARKRPARAR